MLTYKMDIKNQEGDWPLQAIVVVLTALLTRWAAAGTAACRCEVQQQTGGGGGAEVGPQQAEPGLPLPARSSLQGRGQGGDGLRDCPPAPPSPARPLLTLLRAPGLP